MKYLPVTLSPFVKFSAVILSVILVFSMYNTAFSQSLITTVSIQSVSSEYPTIEATHLLTNDGFGPGTPATFTNLYITADIWQTLPYQAQGTNWIIFDLGANYDLASFHIWNLNFYNSGTNYTGRGISRLTLLTSDNGTTYTSHGTITLNQGTGSTSYTGDDFNAPWTNVRYVEFSNLYSFQNGNDDAGHMGLSKVQFSAVPEPASSTLVIGIGFLATSLFRRRKA